jgi:hypothetical protein
VTSVNPRIAGSVTPPPSSHTAKSWSGRPLLRLERDMESESHRFAGARPACRPRKPATTPSKLT